MIASIMYLPQEHFADIKEFHMVMMIVFALCTGINVNLKRIFGVHIQYLRIYSHLNDDFNADL